MRDLITIGELAKLMDVSIHQLRYFEEKGILLAKYKDENGYRLYGEHEIYKAAHILFLRKFNISVSDIGMCFENYKEEDYVKLLNTKLIHINEQIKKLTSLRDLTIDTIDKLNNVHILEEEYIIKRIEERSIQQICAINYESTYSVRDFYDDVNHIPYLYEKDIITLYDDNMSYVCIEVDKHNSQITNKLSEGKYLCHFFLADNEASLEKEASNFLKYAQKNNIKVKGKLIVQENSILSICHNNHMYYEMQCLIDEN